MSNIIWIDTNINGTETKIYVKQLKDKGYKNVKLYKNVNDAIYEMKLIKFEETFIIVSGKLYPEFVKCFKENVTFMHIVPKIIVFAFDKEKFFEYNKDFLNKENCFYNYGGINTLFKQVKEFIDNTKKIRESSLTREDLPIPSSYLPLVNQDKINSSNEIQLTFEYIDCKEKLILPLFFKTLIDNITADNIEQYTNSLYQIYSNKNDKIKNLLEQMISMPNIPLEIIAKYYVRLYTLASDFYKNMNKDLGLNKIDKYLQYIKTLYEGVKLKSLSLASNNILYRGSKISNNEIDKIKNYLSNKVKGLPGAIVFSKSFLSFTKKKSIAENFLSNKIKNLSEVLFILEKDDNLDYNLSTHGDIEKISYFSNEKEVLFFPFSSFEIKELKEINIGNEKRYEMKLLYLGKYLKDIEDDKNITMSQNIIPDSEFKKQLSGYGLVNKERIDNINTKTLYNNYKKYEREVNEIKIKRDNIIINNNRNTIFKESKKINENKDDASDSNNKNKIENNSINKNFIIGEINIDQGDTNFDVQIINSFENFEKQYLITEFYDPVKFYNEKELKQNTEIKIDGKIIEFSYYYKFQNKGIHTIEYSFKNNLTKINQMFCGCGSLTSLNFSNFDAQNVTNMNKLFSGCYSLIKLDLSNFNTKNVTNMSGMFDSCGSLTDLNLSNFNTQNVTNMSRMFANCESLTSLNLSNFNTQNVTNMSRMFANCESLTSLNLSNFNTQNVTNMSQMLYNCISLEKKNLITKDKKILREINEMQ